MFKLHLEVPRRPLTAGSVTGAARGARWPLAAKHHATDQLGEILDSGANGAL